LFVHGEGLHVNGVSLQINESVSLDSLVTFEYSMMIKVNELAPTFHLFVVELQGKNTIKKGDRTICRQPLGTSKLPFDKHASLRHHGRRGRGSRLVADAKPIGP
jgi:hypothetical protein